MLIRRSASPSAGGRGSRPSAGAGRGRTATGPDSCGWSWRTRRCSTLCCWRRGTRARTRCQRGRGLGRVPALTRPRTRAARRRPRRGALGHAAVRRGRPAGARRLGRLQGAAARRHGRARLRDRARATGARTGPAAVRELLREALADPSVHAVIAHTLPEQGPSPRVLEKAGFHVPRRGDRRSGPGRPGGSRILDGALPA